MGQWKHPGKVTRIPSNQITMKGVPYPVYGKPNVGKGKLMQPGGEYSFPNADYVDEYPQMRKGGRTRGLVPMPKPSKKGLASKKYSRSLEATNRLFAESPLFKKQKSKKNKIYDPKAKYYQSGGYIDIELDDEEIKKYVNGGYIVEDISVPTLTRAQDGIELGSPVPKPDLIQVPRAKINVDPNLDRYASRAEKISSYSPIEAEYKDKNRPESKFLPSEDVTGNLIEKLKTSGYFPVKTESGDYEIFKNKDISDLIYQKGMSPEELSENFKLGNKDEIKKHFEPIYTHASGLHAQRNKNKIDNLIKSGLSKDQAISQLVKQGEGTAEGLNSLYGSYTQEAFNRQQEEAKKLLEQNKQEKGDDLKEEYENIFAKQEEERQKEIEKMQEDIDYSGSLQPSETLVNVANKYIGQYGTKGKDVYSENEAKKLELQKKQNDINEEAKVRDVTRKLLDAPNLTDDQKKFYLNNPAELEDLVSRYSNWENTNTAGQSYTTASGLSLPQIGKTEFDFTPGSEGYTTIRRESAPSDRIDMLDKEIIKGVTGIVGLPAASAAASTLLKAAPSAAPWLNIGNVLTAKGVYDTATEYAPNVVSAVSEANEKGWNNDLIGKTVYNTTKGILSGALPLTSLNTVKAVKNAKAAFTAADNAVPITNQSTDPIKHIKFLNAAHSIGQALQRKGGSQQKYIESELTQKEIDDLIAQGYVIEELD